MFTAQEIYGTTPQAPVWGVAAPTQPLATSGDMISGWRGLVSPKNPLTWVGLIILGAVGLAGVAGSARLGPVKVAGSVGKS